MRTLNKLVESIKVRGFLFTLALIIDSMTRKILFKILSKKNYIRWKALIRLGYLVNLENPKTFNEKILSRKMKRINIKEQGVLADKLLVRNYINKKIGHEYLTKIYHVISDEIQIEEFNLQTLPHKFVIKANHGSGLNIIIDDKYQINESSIKKTLSCWLQNNYNKTVAGTEFHYDNIKPKVFFEEYLQTSDGSRIIDYKFFCFDGFVKFIQIVDNNHLIPIMALYSKEWEKMEFGLYNKNTIKKPERPLNWEELIKTAELLSTEFNFVRVDLYSIDNKRIVFGELTFNPGGGFLRFVPKSYDLAVGKMLV